MRGQRTTKRVRRSFGGALVAFGLSHWLWLSLFLLTLVGGGMMVQMAASNTILQTLVSEDKRGRVMSLYTMAFFGMAPFGSLAAGWLGQHIGAPATIIWGGVATIVAGDLFARRLPALREMARPIYRERGVLPEIAAGLNQSAELTSPPEE